MCSAIPIVARDKSFADDLHVDQGRVSSRAALLLRSTERHPSDPRFVPNTHTRGLHARACLPPHIITHPHPLPLSPPPTITHTQPTCTHTHTSKHTPRDESPVGDDELKTNASNHRCLVRHARPRVRQTRAGASCVGVRATERARGAAALMWDECPRITRRGGAGRGRRPEARARAFWHAFRTSFRRWTLAIFRSAARGVCCI